MKNSINNLMIELTANETLNIQQLSAVKGGAGEDLRRPPVGGRILVIITI